MSHPVRPRFTGWLAKSQLAALFLAIGSALACAQLPQNNPVAAHYDGTPHGYPAWTDEVRWGNVVDMSAYPHGMTDFERFEHARDALHAQGGGVLYYPAGDYDFTDMPASGPDGRGLMLREGIVLRGEPPSTDTEAVDGSLTLPTRFIFGFDQRPAVLANSSYIGSTTGETPRDWNFVGLAPDTANGEALAEVDRVGVVWIHFVGAAIYWGADLTWGSTMATAGGWKSALVKDTWADRVPDGTHPWDPFAGAPVSGGRYLGAGNGRLVFGCVFEDSAVMNDIVMENRTGGKNFGPDGYWLFKFGARINVYGSDVFLANNLLPMSTRNFTYEQTVGHNPNQSTNPSNWQNRTETILFNYNTSHGFDVNKGMLNPFADKNLGYFAERVIIRDNWVFNHGRSGFNVSGEWMTILNNHNERLYHGTSIPASYGLGSGQSAYLTLDGYVQVKPGGPGSISDTLSRAFDLAGGPLWIDGNTWGATHSDGNDGEGILCQAHGGTQLYGWAVTRNDGPSYLAGYDVNHYGSLWAWNAAGTQIGNYKAGTLYDFAVAGNTSGSVIATGSAGSGSPLILDCPNGVTLLPPTDVVAVATEDGFAVDITWTDQTTGEIGYRIDRRIGDGSWQTIAYRPRYESGIAAHPQRWVDGTAPRGAELSYRVMPIDCADDASAATEIAEPLLLPGGSTGWITPFADWAAEALAEFPPDQRGQFDNPSGDGIPNAIKFVLGMDPTTYGDITDHIQLSFLFDRPRLYVEMNRDAGAAFLDPPPAGAIRWYYEWAIDPEGPWTRAGRIDFNVVEGGGYAGFGTIPIPTDVEPLFIRLTVEVHE